MTHIGILYTAGLGSTQKDYSVTWYSFQMVPSHNLLPPLRYPIIPWNGRRLTQQQQQQHHKGSAPPCCVLDIGWEGERERERQRGVREDESGSRETCARARVCVCVRERETDRV